MLVRVTQTASAFTFRAVFFAGLFLFVVAAHLSFSSILRELGWSSGAAMTASGAGVLTLVLLVINIADWLRERVLDWRERQRRKHRLPAGPCCVVWRESVSGPAEEAMPWETVGPLRARYPRLARRLGVEGLAIVEFEVAGDGRAKNISCVDAWPSDVFYEAAREALRNARFQPSRDEHMRFGASYRMPFVFRIAGATKLRERSRRARRLRPVLHAAQAAMARLRHRSA